MKKLFSATLLTLLVAVNLLAANHTLNRTFDTCLTSGDGTSINLQAIWTDQGPTPQCGQFSYSHVWTVGGGFNGGTILSVECGSPTLAVAEIYKPGPNCDCIDTTTTLTTVTDTAPPACSPQNPYGTHLTDDCN